MTTVHMEGVKGGTRWRRAKGKRGSWSRRENDSEVHRASAFGHRVGVGLVAVPSAFSQRQSFGRLAALSLSPSRLFTASPHRPPRGPKGGVAAVSSRLSTGGRLRARRRRQDNAHATL